MLRGAEREHDLTEAVSLRKKRLLCRLDREVFGRDDDLNRCNTDERPKRAHPSGHLIAAGQSASSMQMRMILNYYRIDCRVSQVQNIAPCSRFLRVAPRAGSGRTSPWGPRVRAQRLRVAMGTWTTIEATAPTAPLAAAGIEAAYRAIADVERRMHPLREGSEVARLNSSTPQTCVPIADSTWRVLQLAKVLHRL